MHRNLLQRLTGVFLGACLLASTAQAAEPAWQPLFNGRNLEGWSAVHDVTFEVHEGNLRLVKGWGWLRTEQSFEDFILEFEWRGLEDRYDSGVFFRAGLEGKPWPNNGWQVNLRHDSIGGLVQGYTARQASPIPSRPVGQWVRCRLEVRGTTATLEVDGQRAWQYEAIDAPRGFIGIQAEDRAFDFRNVRLLPLPANP